MAVEAGLTLIDVSRHALMRLIHIRLIVLMTINAREAVVIASDMAIGAGSPRFVVRPRVDWEIKVVMIENRALPGDRGMA